MEVRDFAVFDEIGSREEQNQSDGEKDDDPENQPEKWTPIVNF